MPVKWGMGRQLEQQPVDHIGGDIGNRILGSCELERARRLDDGVAGVGEAALANFQC